MISYILVRSSGIHGKGVFAARDIKKGTKVIEYVGQKVTKKQGDEIYERSVERAKKDKSKGIVYLFELNKKYDIDGDFAYNKAKWINHSCDPNCETDVIKGKIWIIALKDIKKGEELSYDYGYAFDEDFKDHKCRCKAKKCFGYILGKEHHGKALKRLKK